jgi:hypothetical protein
LFLKGGQNLNFSVAAEHVAEVLASAQEKPQPWFKLPLPPSESLSKTNGNEAQTQRLADFEAASKFAESAAEVTGILENFARVDPSVDLSKNVRRALDFLDFGKLLSEWNRHSKVLATYDDQLNVVSDGLVECAGQSYSNAHEAALGVADRIVTSIAMQLAVAGVKDQSDAPVSPDRLDSSLIEANWPIVRRTIRLLPTFDHSVIMARVARERAKIIDRRQRGN